MAPSPDRSAAAPPAREVYSVTRVNREVRALLERGLPVLWVEGELTNFSQPASGHWYFTLKDREAQLRCAMFRMRNALVGFTPSAGAQVLVRGGGSLEDLWAYNDERVARAIYASRLPIVSGVGHEIDFTIADFVADARAPTPSAAAELVAPDGAACLQFLARSAERLAAAMRRELRASGARSEATERRLKLVHPGVRLQQQMQRLDDLAQRLAALVHAAVGRDRLRLAQSLERLVRRSPEHLAREHRLRHQGVHSRLLHAMRECVARAAHRLALAQRALNAVSPLATLTRGFAIVTRGADGSLLTNAATVAVGEEIEARLAHGRLNARVTGRSGES